MNRSMAAAFILIAFAACGNGSPAGPDMDVTFRRIAAGSFGTPRQEVVVVRDQTAWTRVLADLGLAQPPGTINFSTEMVLVVLGGQRPTAGYSVRVDRVTQKSSGLEVSAVVQRPHSSCIVAQVITSPFEVIALARSDLAVTAAWSETTGPECRQ